MASKNAILVTGSHRSGTTWVGRTIAASPSVVYFHEPFNLDRPVAERWVPAQYALTYVCAENEGQYAEPVRRILEWQFNPNRPGGAHARPAGTATAVRDRLRLMRYRLLGARPLVKDPLAVLSAPWLAQKFNMQVVVMIRHPAAFVSSIKMLNWTHPFGDFLSQPLLMKDYLHPFETDIREYSAGTHAVIDQAAFLWKLLYYVIGKFVRQYPHWIFVRHEDLSRDLLAGFRALFDKLDLEFSPPVVDYIRAQSLARDTADQSRLDPYALKRNSLANISHWKTRLTPDEIERVKCQVQDVSKNFYSEQDW